MKTWLKIMLGVVISLIILGALFGNTGRKYENTNQPIKENSNGDLNSENCLKILDYNKTKTEYGSLAIKGTAMNVAGKQLSYAEVRAKFYDKEGNLIDGSFDNINDLDSGEKWNFQIVYLGTDASKVQDYKIAVGTCF